MLPWEPEWFSHGDLVPRACVAGCAQSCPARAGERMLPSGEGSRNRAQTMCVPRQPPSELREESRAPRKLNSRRGWSYTANTVLKHCQTLPWVQRALPHSGQQQSQRVLQLLSCVLSSLCDSWRQCWGESSSIEKDVWGLSEFQNFFQEQVHVYGFIYIHIHTYIYMYTYIYTPHLFLTYPLLNQNISVDWKQHIMDTMHYKKRGKV